MATLPRQYGDFPPEQPEFPPRQQQFPPRQPAFPPRREVFAPMRRDNTSRTRNAPQRNKNYSFYNSVEDYIRRNVEPLWNSALKNSKNTRAKIKRPSDNTQYPRTLEDFLRMADEYLSKDTAYETDALGSQEAALRRAAAEIQGQIGSGYNALTSFISGQAQPIQSAYEAGIQGSADAAQRAQESISQGTAAAQAQQQAILDRLGIADTNIVLNNNNTTLEDQMAQQIAESAGRGQAAQTELSGNMSTALDYNAGMGVSAALEGQSQQNRIARDLMQRLAEIADERSAISRSSSKDRLGLAQQLMGTDYQLWEGNYNRKYNADRDALDIAMQQAQASNQEPEPMTSVQWSQLGPAGQSMYTLTQSGIDPQSAGIIVQQIGQEVADGNINSQGELVKRMQDIAQEMGLDPISTANAALIYYKWFE